MKFTSLSLFSAFLFNSINDPFASLALASSSADKEQECRVDENGNQVCEANLLDDDDDDYLNDDDDDFVDKGASPPTSSTKKEDPTNCIDTHELCSLWASNGECAANPNFMLQGCKKSCNNCSDNLSRNLQSTKQKVDAEKPHLLNLIKQYGEEQRADGDKADLTMLVIKKTIDYMKNYIHAEKPTHHLSQSVLDACTNNHELCAFWAAIGECEKNISFMQTKCAPSCQSCANIDFDTRCPKRSDDAVPALKPNDLNLMFERIVATAPGNQTEATQALAQQKAVMEDGMPYYTVHVQSSPKIQSKDEGYQVSLDFDKSQDPWVITFENLLTDEECDELIALGHKEGYDRSKDVGAKATDGSYDGKVSTTRTSENAWCSDKNGCRAHPVAKRIHDRIQKVLGIPSQNYEDFQMLRYEKGQFYRTHHDYIPHQKDRACGPRILTFFLYLSDVEEGGGTGLGQITDPITGKKGLVVNPKKGKALLWPSIYNHDPMEKDGRTTHEAISVDDGVKFAANAWVHMYDVIETQKKGCT